jgi:adenylyl- and sulfurtransferase ThiI
VSQTEFFNVLVMKVSNIPQFLEQLNSVLAEDPHLATVLARVVPVSASFTFQLPEEFEEKAREIALQWLPQLAGKGFHVRMRRRGFKGRLSSLEVERSLGALLLEALEKAGTPGHLTFENPDAIAVVETLGQWAGLSCWTREELERYPWMRVD